MRRIFISFGVIAALLIGAVLGVFWERTTLPPAPASPLDAGNVKFQRRPALGADRSSSSRDVSRAIPSSAIRLVPGQAHRATMTFRENPQHEFVVAVPENAVVLQVEITAAPCIFDIFGRAGAPIDDPLNDAEHYNLAVENKLRVSRYDDLPLETGDFYLTVEYPSFYPPVIGNRTLTKTAYEIAVSFVAQRLDGELTPGQAQEARLDPDSGSFRTFVVEVPADAETLRIDLDNSHSDLDVLARHDQQILHPEDADHVGVGRVGREILIIDKHSDPPLEPGRWFVNVIEAMAIDDAGFTIYASLDSKAPETLLAIPAPPPTPDGKWRALYAAVDLTTGTYAGSGVLISPTGLILTNHHVVAEAVVAAKARRQIPTKRDAEKNGGAPALDDVIVAVTLDPRHPPVEMFRAEVVEYDEKEDLALVQVTRGYYGQPLPKAYRFPYIEFGEPDKLEIGDPLYVVGFPNVGDLRNRPAVTLTQGIVSGFSGLKNIKCDAHISSGNSGGGAFDASWRLVGCPTYTVSGADGDYGQLGYLVSVAAFPEAWRHRVPQTAPDSSTPE